MIRTVTFPLSALVRTYRVSYNNLNVDSWFWTFCQICIRIGTWGLDTLYVTYKFHRTSLPGPFTVTCNEYGKIDLLNEKMYFSINHTIKGGNHYSFIAATVFERLWETNYKDQHWFYRVLWQMHDSYKNVIHM